MSMTSKWLWTNAVRSIGPSMLRTCSFEAATRVRTAGAIPYFNPASTVCHMACGWLLARTALRCPPWCSSPSVTVFFVVRASPIR